MTVKTVEVTVRADGEGEQRWFCGGGLHTWKATAEETGGAFLIFEDDLDAGKVTPLHRHPDADETFYMLEGEILLHVGGRSTAPLLAGGIAVIPRGIPHAFMVTSGRARMLCLQTPGSGEALLPPGQRAGHRRPIGPAGRLRPGPRGRREHRRHRAPRTSPVLSHPRVQVTPPRVSLEPCESSKP